jgi:hypothetical protein
MRIFSSLVGLAYAAALLYGVYAIREELRLLRKERDDQRK